MIQKLTKLDVMQLQDAYGAWFDETYEQVWEEFNRPLFHYVRRPWGAVLRPLYRARHFVLQLSWRSTYWIYRRHPHAYWQPGGLLRKLQDAWKCERTPCGHAHVYWHRYGPPIWKAD